MNKINIKITNINLIINNNKNKYINEKNIKAKLGYSLVELLLEMMLDKDDDGEENELSKLISRQCLLCIVLFFFSLISFLIYFNFIFYF